MYLSPLDVSIANQIYMVQLLQISTKSLLYIDKLSSIR